MKFWEIMCVYLFLGPLLSVSIGLAYSLLKTGIKDFIWKRAPDIQINNLSDYRELEKIAKKAAVRKVIYFSKNILTMIFVITISLLFVLIASSILVYDF